MTVKKPLVVLVGPTAIGKTKTSISLAKALNAEIISGDSMQVYRGMNIGTAKIITDEMDGVNHHLIDICEPIEPFNASLFKQRAVSEIGEIYKKGKLPMVVGGTGLYINSLIYDFDFRRSERDNNLRKHLEARIQDEGGEVLLKELRKSDPELAEKLYPADHKRIVRALEIIYSQDRTISEQENILKKYESPYNLCLIGLRMERQKIYERINQRVDIMIEAGLVNEVESLLLQGVDPLATSMQGIGYKEMIAHLNGELSLEEAVERIKRNTRRFAKRQLTWFNRDPNIRWFDVDTCSDSDLYRSILAYINSILQSSI